MLLLEDFNLYSCNSNICNYFEYFMSFCEFTQYYSVPNCKGRQLDLVLAARSDVHVTGADEALRPVDAYHPPLAVMPPTITATSITADFRRWPPRLRPRLPYPARHTYQYTLRSQ
ncbi:unnamed protein product [Parnassius apollo]|uniref:(apollo) hypothetical protein n=1 Tax=Parnassius apollo TaxID=110799 RepID=A0A8S3X9M4_PARAO|nr:unnamed protein product [Parnassius apollo]